MTSENQRRVLAATSRVGSELAEAAGVGPFNYEKAVESLRTHGPRNIYDLLLVLIKKLMPDMADRITLTPEDVPQFLDAIQTRERAEAMLSQLPDEPADQIEALLDEVLEFVYNIRSLMLATAKRLPHDPGGQPKMFSAEERQQIRDEIGRLLAQGVRLKDAQTRLAQRKAASLTTIQRVWREPRKQQTIGENDIK